MALYDNYDRTYILMAGHKKKKGKASDGFSVGQGSTPLHISFSLEKSDLTTQNTAKIDIWNLTDAHIAVLEKKECILSLYAGYGTHDPLIFAGQVSFVSTILDNADRKTHIEVVDNLISDKNKHISLSYKGKTGWKRIFDDASTKMGIPIIYAKNLKFKNVPKFSYVGKAAGLLDKGCKANGFSWSIQNGIVTVKKKKGHMGRPAYLISAETGMIGYPEKVSFSDSDDSKKTITGWDVTCFLNGAINVDDYVRLESKQVKGYFCIYSIQIEGDNVSGDWTVKARLVKEGDVKKSTSKAETSSTTAVTSSGDIGTNSEVIEKAIQWITEKISNPRTKKTLGSASWKDDWHFSCSSIITKGYIHAGVDLPTGFYTDSVPKQYLKHGFVEVTKQINFRTGSGLKRGDVIINKKHSHSGMYFGKYKGRNNIILNAHQGYWVSKYNGATYPWARAFRLKE